MIPFRLSVTLLASYLCLESKFSVEALHCYLMPYISSFNSIAASRISAKIDGVRDLTYAEMSLATNNFNDSNLVGQGGYGKVYRGILADGTVVAIKRAQEGSLQGEKEFLTEIELLSRLHHRNLVSLIGYCDEEGEQVSLMFTYLTYIQSVVTPSIVLNLESRYSKEVVYFIFYIICVH